MSDDVEHLIEKFGLAIHGEQPEVVILVLTAFIAELLSRYGISVDDFADGLRTARLKARA
jgi:hypothetical protein